MTATGFLHKLLHRGDRYPVTAQEWAVRITSEDMTPRELQALNDWLKASPANADAFAQLNKVSHVGLRMRDYPDVMGQLRGYAELKERESKQVRVRHLPAWIANSRLAPVGGLAIASVIAITLYIATGGGESSYTAAHGEQRQVVLDDGSRLHVNTDSSVRVTYSATARHVELARGEAFFEVRPDPSRPFVVTAGRSEIRVVGTKFNVLRVGDSADVVVLEGKVRVVPSAGAAVDKALELSPGQRAVVESSAVEAVQVVAVDALQVTAWTSGVLEFRETPLREVIHEVNRYIHKPYYIADDEHLGDIRLSGRFRTGDEETVRFALRERFGMEAVDEGTRVKLRRP